MESLTKQELQFAKVIATSEFTASEDRQVSVGDKVVFEKYSGTEVKDGDDSFLILDIDNVLAITE